MSSLQKIIVLCIGGGVILIGGFFLVNSYVYQEKEADETMQETNMPRIEVETAQTEVTASNDGTEEEGVCFDAYRDTPYKIASAMDTTEWRQLDIGIAGFAFRYPDTVSVSETEISARTDFHKASITTYKLRQGYAAPYIHASPIFYEPLSNTWWKYPSFYVLGQNPSDAEECIPNEIGRTLIGDFPIYLTVDGDIGVSVYTYFVVMRDVVQSDNYEPLIVEFKTVIDGNSSNAATFGGFQDILENIIRTVEVRPTSKG